MPITIKIKENGPYLISLEDSASVVIVNAAGERFEPTPGKGIALCRCGHSGRKPFCDATHRTIAFQGACSAPAVPAAPPEPLVVAGSPAPLAPATLMASAVPSDPPASAATAVPRAPVAPAATPVPEATTAPATLV